MRLKRFQRIGLGIILLIGLGTVASAGTAPDTNYGSLKGKRIFLDPGHGGTAAGDPLRIGPYGITEESINLQVGLLLRDLLVQAGALVIMSRTTDSDVELPDRVRAAVQSMPDILVSIHHNATIRGGDAVNYPCVFFWGSDTVNPASFDLARLLLPRFEDLIGIQGRVLSDFCVYPETGTLLLRETRDLCPGVIGEAGFITDPEHARRLLDPTYLQAEAQCYARALSTYFRQGCPTATARFSCRVDREGPAKNMISEAQPDITLELESGTDQAGIDLSTLALSLDGIPASFEKVSDEKVRVCYGTRIHPGMHRLQFQFRNGNHQSSMVYTLPFFLEIHQGDRERLIREGRAFLKRSSTRQEGLKMLIAALSINPTAPDADALLYELAQGFRACGDEIQSQYFLERLYYFYPQSSLRAGIEGRIRTARGCRFPADFFGKEAVIVDAEKGGASQ